MCGFGFTVSLLGGAELQIGANNEKHPSGGHCCCILCFASCRARRKQRQIKHCTWQDGRDARSSAASAARWGQNFRPRPDKNRAERQGECTRICPTENEIVNTAASPPVHARTQAP